jgi:acetyl-CoA carboxylase biotin carboxyl carrier protein
MALIKVVAEIPGSVWKIEMAAGDAVSEDDTILILESMKMEIPVTAPRDGKLVEILVKEGDTIAEGQAVATLEA